MKQPYAPLRRVWCLLALLLRLSQGFQLLPQEPLRLRLGPNWLASNADNNPKETNRFEETDIASKGIVSSLTSVANSLAGTRVAVDPDKDDSAPTSPQELMQRIQADYEESNYLWTGGIDLACFDADCKFQDPTLSFVGRNQFVENVQNLQPIVDALVTNERSILLDIQLDEDEGFVQTRWNMVGDFSGLFWKPRLDVIGRTRFWYQSNATSVVKSGDSAYSVYFYDEEWEIPAFRALLQLFTPAGGNSDSK